MSSDHCFNPILDTRETELETLTGQKYCPGCSLRLPITDFYTRRERKGKYQYVRPSPMCKKCTTKAAMLNKLRKK